MPEGPEVRRQAEFLVESLTGTSIESIELLSGRYTKKPFSGYRDLIEKLPVSVIGGGVHGKFMYVILGDGSSLQLTLGMTGQWLSKRHKHARVRLTTNKADLFYTDQRNFGTIKWQPSKVNLVAKLKKLGPDIMQSGGKEDFIQKIRRKNHWNICKALMDQNVVAGIGNYLKAEVLYATAVSPWSQVGELSDNKLELIFESAGKLAWQSYHSGGATIQSYRNPDGSSGSASQRFAVYGQEKSICGNPIIREKTPDGRTTHWAPAVQSEK
jgi:formamidopyrimidine-DNA glycosylase